MDCLDKKTEYQNILLQIADTQNKLLRLSLDLETRFAIMIQPKKAGLFGRKKKTERLEKERLLYELDNLKTRARIILDISEDSNTFFWWNVPWDYVEEYLVYGLMETEENENWRHQYKWLSLSQNNTYLMLLEEEGHCSRFDGTSELEFYETSPYSNFERQELVNKYKNKMNNIDFGFCLALDGYKVHSELTDTTYDSATDYMLSAEHYLVRDYFENQYEKSLKTEHQANRVFARSNSLHYHSLYAVAEYQLTSNGCLSAWNYYEHLLVDYKGELPQESVEERQKRDAALSFMLFIANQKDVTAIPAGLFGDGVLGTLTSIEEAVGYSAVLTCLAEKIRF